MWRRRPKYEHFGIRKPESERKEDDEEGGVVE